jgi:hypothetical protein
MPWVVFIFNPKILRMQKETDLIKLFSQIRWEAMNSSLRLKHLDSWRFLARRFTPISIAEVSVTNTRYKTLKQVLATVTQIQ